MVKPITEINPRFASMETTIETTGIIVKTTIKRLYLTKRYKKQRKFVVFDCGSHFTKRYGVMGLTTKLFKYTQYFGNEQDAIRYYFKMMSKFKDYKEVTNEWKSRGYL